MRRIERTSRLCLSAVHSGTRQSRLSVYRRLIAALALLTDTSRVLGIHLGPDGEWQKLYPRQRSKTNESRQQPYKPFALFQKLQVVSNPSVASRPAASSSLFPKNGCCQSSPLDGGFVSLCLLSLLRILQTGVCAFRHRAGASFISPASQANVRTQEGLKLILDRDKWFVLGLPLLYLCIDQVLTNSKVNRSFQSLYLCRETSSFVFQFVLLVLPYSLVPLSLKLSSQTIK